MRCAICDALLSEPQFNSDIDGYEPCDTCLAIINDTAKAHLDKPSADEDELGGSDIPVVSYYSLKEDMAYEE